MQKSLSFEMSEKLSDILNLYKKLFKEEVSSSEENFINSINFSNYGLSESEIDDLIRKLKYISVSNLNFSSLEFYINELSLLKNENYDPININIRLMNFYNIPVEFHNNILYSTLSSSCNNKNNILDRLEEICLNYKQTQLFTKGSVGDLC